jgi:hypothetical protein
MTNAMKKYKNWKLKVFHASRFYFGEGINTTSALAGGAATTSGNTSAQAQIPKHLVPPPKKVSFIL